MPEKTLKKLKIGFITCISLCTLFLAADALYTTKYTEPVSNVALERWSIIITLFGIYAALKLLHPRLKDEDRISEEHASKKYVTKYYTRLILLIVLFVFNAAAMHITGIKNFIFLGFITIFAMFLCAPNRTQIESEIKNE